MPRKKVKNEEVPKYAFHLKVESIIGYKLDFEPLEKTWSGGPKPGTPTVAKLKVEWTSGGMTGGSCWDTGEEDNHRPIDPDPEPEFEDLNKVLEALCPNISFLQYKKLSNSLIKHDEYQDYEYYANYYNKSVKFVVLPELEQYLKDSGLWSGE